MKETQENLKKKRMKQKEKLENLQRNKKEHGITLIALVVTIVVLLILAGITINMLFSNGGIFKVAQDAANAWNQAVINEQADLDNLTEQIQNLVNGQVGGGTGGKTLVQAFKDGEIKVGDYITDYNQKLKNSSASVNVTEEETGFAGTQAYRVDTSTTWRVLGLSEDGTQLMITTGSPIKKVMNPAGTEEWEKDPYLYLKSAEAYYHTNDELTDENILDKICKIYDSNLAEKTQSMRIEDINTVVGLTLDKEKNIMYKTADETKTPIESYQGFFGEKYTYKIGDYAPENYLKEKYPSKYQSLTAKKANDTVDGTAFAFSYEDPSVVDPNSKLYEILFKGTTEEDHFAKSYWLASSSVNIGGSSSCNFGPGVVYEGYVGTGYYMFFSGGYTYADWHAVRPVVYLRSDVTVKDLTTTESGTEQDWTTSAGGSSSGEDLEYGQIKN